MLTPPGNRRMRTARPTSLFALEAQKHLAAGRPKQAVEVCKMGLVYYPEHVTGYVVLAKAFLALDKGAQAINVLRDGYRRTGVEQLEALRAEISGESPTRERGRSIDRHVVEARSPERPLSHTPASTPSIDLPWRPSDPEPVEEERVEAVEPVAAAEETAEAEEVESTSVVDQEIPLPPPIEEPPYDPANLPAPIEEPEPAPIDEPIIPDTPIEEPVDPDFPIEEPSLPPAPIDEPNDPVEPFEKAETGIEGSYTPEQEETGSIEEESTFGDRAITISEVPPVEEPDAEPADESQSAKIDDLESFSESTASTVAESELELVDRFEADAALETEPVSKPEPIEDDRPSTAETASPDPIEEVDADARPAAEIEEDIASADPETAEVELTVEEEAAAEHQLDELLALLEMTTEEEPVDASKESSLEQRIAEQPEVETHPGSQEVREALDETLPSFDATEKIPELKPTVPRLPEAAPVDREPAPERGRSLSLAIHSRMNVTRLRSSNLRLIPGLEFAPLRHEDQQRSRQSIAPLIDETVPPFDLPERHSRTGDAPPLPSFGPYTPLSLGSDEEEDLETFDSEPMAGGVFSLESPPPMPKSFLTRPEAREGETLTPLEELARRLEKARIPVVEEAEPRHAFEPSIVSDTFASILVAQGAYAEALKAYQTLARTKPERYEHYQQQIHDMQERIHRREAEAPREDEEEED